jgi:exodeoxyribonuclease VII large subunit
MDRTRDFAAGREVWTVSRLNREARALLESLPSLWVEGELSNLARPASGHWYFSLKDASAQVRCVMWRSANARARIGLREGMQLLVRARASLYEPRGEYQLVVDHVEEAGEGLLRRRFEELKARLAAEGLFDAALKRPLPTLPRRVGVVTSPTGAAIRDILHVLARRFPAVPVVVYPVPVQGALAAAAIAAALAVANQRAECDVLILARGGGSLEDLWSFNEEVVARAIRGSRIPVITGVGHEVDFTIADFVADVRAPTPSGAAELVVPDAGEWRRAVAGLATRLDGALRRGTGRARERLAWLSGRLARVHPREHLARRGQRLDELEARLARAFRVRLEATRARLLAAARTLDAVHPRERLGRRSQRLEELEGRLARAFTRRVELGRARLLAASRTLNAVSPLATLERGYAILEDSEGRVVRAAAQVSVGDALTARTGRGRVYATVTGTGD